MKPEFRLALSLPGSTYDPNYSDSHQKHENIKSLLTLSAALLAMAVSSSATVYNDTNTHNGLVEEGDTVTGQWSYSIAAGEIVTSVESWFNFESADSQKEQALVKVGVGEGVDDQSITSSFTNFGSLYTVHFNASSLASLLSDAANGLLSYSVTATNLDNLATTSPSPLLK